MVVSILLMGKEAQDGTTRMVKLVHTTMLDETRSMLVELAGLQNVMNKK